MQSRALFGRSRNRRRGERSGRADHAVDASAAQPHRAACDSCATRGGGRTLRTGTRHGAGQQRSRLPDARGAQTVAQQVPHGRRRHDGRQFRRGFGGRLRRLHQRGKRRFGNFVSRPAHRHHGAGKGNSRLPVAGGLYPSAGAFGDGAARDGLYVAVSPSRTGQADPCGNRRQRPHRIAAQRGAPQHAQMFALRRLHEHLPRLPAVGRLLLLVFHSGPAGDQSGNAAFAGTVRRKRVGLFALLFLLECLSCPDRSGRTDLRVAAGDGRRRRGRRTKKTNGRRDECGDAAQRFVLCGIETDAVGAALRL